MMHSSHACIVASEAMMSVRTQLVSLSADGAMRLRGPVELVPATPDADGLIDSNAKFASDGAPTDAHFAQAEAWARNGGDLGARRAAVIAAEIAEIVTEARRRAVPKAGVLQPAAHQQAGAPARGGQQSCHCPGGDNNESAGKPTQPEACHESLMQAEACKRAAAVDDAQVGGLPALDKENARRPDGGLRKTWP